MFVVLHAGLDTLIPQDRAQGQQACTAEKHPQQPAHLVLSEYQVLPSPQPASKRVREVLRALDENMLQ